MTDASSTPRVLVFGATGYTGRALVPLARAAGCEVFAHVRPNSPSGEACAPAFEACGAQVVRCAWEAGAITAMMKDHAPTLVFALLGTTRKKASAGPGADYMAVDYGMTKMALDGLRQLCADSPQEPPRRFVYLSAFGVRQDTNNAYMRARALIERELREPAQPLGFDWIVARPAFITGPDRKESRPGERVGAVVSDGVLGLFGALGFRDTRDRYASIQADALAAGLLSFALDPGAGGRTLDSAQLRRAPRVWQ